MNKDVTLSYVLALLCFFGPAGLHRFYLGRHLSGILYLLTWGFFGIGTIIDLFNMSDMVKAENAKLLEGRHAPLLPPAPTPEPASPERQILMLAKIKSGKVTVPMVALETKLSLEEAKKELERLRKAGHCELDVTEEGAELYTFAGLGSTTPLLS